MTNEQSDKQIKQLVDIIIIALGNARHHISMDNFESADKNIALAKETTQIIEKLRND